VVIGQVLINAQTGQVLFARRERTGRAGNRLFPEGTHLAVASYHRRTLASLDWAPSRAIACYAKVRGDVHRRSVLYRNNEALFSLSREPRVTD
jgi:hypothetical protein